MSGNTEMSSIVMQEAAGELGLSHFRPLDELGLKKTDLEKAIVAQPNALVLDPLDMLSGGPPTSLQPCCDTPSAVAVPTGLR